MADFFGTTAADALVGTQDDDTFTVTGNDTKVIDQLIGQGGADRYIVRTGLYNTVIVDDRGTDGALDILLTTNGLYNTFSTGAIDSYATARRSGDTLILTLPGENSWWRHAGTADVELRLVGQYAGTGIETLTTPEGTYNLATGATGTAQADILAGDGANDSFSARGGRDFVFGNGGNDTLDLGAGNDYVTGGNGRDRIHGGTGRDRILGDDGNDVIDGDGGKDSLSGGDGRDVLRGGNGDDRLSGDAGNDRLIGGTGRDLLSGGAGDDLMVGQKGADRFVISIVNGPAGDDVIRDIDRPGDFLAHDVVVLQGVSAGFVGNQHPSAARFDALSFARAGDDAILTLTEAGDTITFDRMFDARLNGKGMIDELQIGGPDGYRFFFVDAARSDIANDRDWFQLYGSELNEIIFATAGDDEIFGGTGVNIILSGGGADTFIYKPGDGIGIGTMGGGVSHDIIEDFDLARDVLDFTEFTNEVASYTLTYSQDAQGDAVIELRQPDYEIANILVELRGVSLAELQASDALLF